MSTRLNFQISFMSVPTLRACRAVRAILLDLPRRGYPRRTQPDRGRPRPDTNNYTYAAAGSPGRTGIALPVDGEGLTTGVGGATIRDWAACRTQRRPSSRRPEAPPVTRSAARHPTPAERGHVH